MSFLNPLLLAVGLGALAIPVAVHLQRRRRKVRVVFSTLHLVEASQRITRRRRRITDWPIMLLRLLAIALLAFGFGRPWLARLAHGTPGRKESVVYVVDVSASMQAGGEVGSVWDEAIDAMARELRNQHPESRVTLVTSPTDENADRVIWKKPAQLRADVKQIEPGFGRANLAAALGRAIGALRRIETDLPRIVHLVSDLQTDATRNLERVSLPADVAIRVTKVGDLVPHNVGLGVAARGEGVLRRGVYSVLVPESGMSALGHVMIQDFDRDGQAQGEPREVRIRAGTLSASEAYSAVETGWHSRRVTLTQEDALAIDNRAFDAFYVQSRVHVLLVEPKIHAALYDQATFFFSRALDPFLGENDRSKRPTRFVPITVAAREAARAVRELDTSSSVVFLPALALTEDLASSLKEFVSAGGGVVLFTGEETRPQIYNQYLGELLPVTIGGPSPIDMRATVEVVSQQHPLWGGLDLANRQKMVRLPLFRRSKTEIVREATVLARFGDGQPLVARKPYGKGLVSFVNTSASRQWGDWPTMGGTYVPTIHLLAAKSLPGTEDSHRNARVQLTYDDTLNFDLGGEFAGQTVAIAGQKMPVYLDGNVTPDSRIDPGIYAAKIDGRVVKSFAVNLDPRESNLESTQAVIVKRQLETQRAQSEPLSVAVHQADGDDALIWKTLLATLAIALALEPLLANLS